MGGGGISNTPHHLCMICLKEIFKGGTQYYKPYSETKQACYCKFSPMFQYLTNYVYMYTRVLQRIK